MWCLGEIHAVMIGSDRSEEAGAEENGRRLHNRAMRMMITCASCVTHACMQAWTCMQHDGQRHVRCCAAARRV